MVYNGVSTGCAKCRQRHIKCDETEPACRKCLSQGFICPGRRGASGIVFKNVSKAVSDRQIRRQHRSQKESVQAELIKSANASTALYTNLTTDLGTQAICYFFRRYILSSSQTPALSRGQFDYLLPLFTAAAPSSALARAVTVMAQQAMGLYLGQDLGSSTYLADQINAARAVQAAIRDPEECLRDETLLAVLCLDFSEHLTSKTTTCEASRAHINGALALIHHRGPASFVNDVSRSLLAGTLSHAVQSILWFPSKQAEDTVSRLPDMNLWKCSPITILHQFLKIALRLENEMTAENESVTIDDGDRSHVPSMLSRAHQLYSDVLGWPRYVPSCWRYLVDCQPYAPPSLVQSMSGTEFPLMQVAYVVGQWYCVKLEALRLLYIICRSARYPRTLYTSTARFAIHEAQTVIDGFPLLLEYFTLDPGRSGGSVDDLARLLERSASGLVPAGADQRRVFRGGTSDGRHYRLTLLSWSIWTITQDDGTDLQFEVAPDTIVGLRKQLSVVMNALNV